MNNTLHCCLECIELLALVSYPVIPETAEKTEALLNFPKGSFFKLGWDFIIQNPPLKTGSSLPEPQILFQRVEDEVIAPYIAELAKIKTMPKVQSPEEKPMISIEDIKKIDLRVGCIESVERVEKSKKLLKVLVNIGSEKRTIVAGIGEGMQAPESLIGRKVIVVANLAPASLCGVESQGMLLAAKGEEGFELPIFSSSHPGDPVA